MVKINVFKIVSFLLILTSSLNTEIFEELINTVNVGLYVCFNFSISLIVINNNQGHLNHGQIFQNGFCMF